MILITLIKYLLVINIITNIRCNILHTGVSSLSHLLDKTLLRAAVWIISGVTCVGNVLVLWGRFTAKDENRVLTIIIRNLAGKLYSKYII